MHAQLDPQPGEVRLRIEHASEDGAEGERRKRPPEDPLRPRSFALRDGATGLSEREGLIEPPAGLLLEWWRLLDPDCREVGNVILTSLDDIEQVVRYPTPRRPMLVQPRLHRPISGHQVGCPLHQVL